MQQISELPSNVAVSLFAFRLRKSVWEGDTRGRLSRKADCPMPRVGRDSHARAAYLGALAGNTYVFLGKPERLAPNLQAQRSGCPKVCGSYRPRCLQAGCGPWVARRSDRPQTWRRAPIMGPSMLQGLRANIVRRSKGWPRTDPCGPRIRPQEMNCTRYPASANSLPCLGTLKGPRIRKKCTPCSVSPL